MGMKCSTFVITVITIVVAFSVSKSSLSVSTTPSNSSKSSKITKTKSKSSSVKSLVLLYTAGARGQIRSCNCTKFRFGGYGREFTLIKSIRKESSDVLLIEGGDTTGEPNMQSELKADVTVSALKLLGYSAMVPGEEELGARGKRYINKFNSAAPPVICANLYELGAKKPKYPPYIVIKTKSGLRIGVVGLLAERVGGPFISKEYGETIKDPAVTLKSLITVVCSKSDLVFAVIHGTHEDAEKLASVKGVNLILSTHRTGELIFPEKDTNQANAPVKKMGNVVLVNAETNANWSLGKIDLTLNKGQGIDSAKHTLLYLDRKYDEDPAMVKIYDNYNEKVKQAVITASAKFKKEAETLLVKRGLNLTEMRKRLRKSPFATAEKCADCHSDICESWSKTRHAHAMATLEKNHQEFDPECISCHATGVTTRNGYLNQKETPELANVQCEACHGPALSHMSSPSKGFGKVDEQACRSCHTDERTPDFDFNKAWAKIKH